MKQLIFFGMALLLLASFVTAAPAAITYTIPDPVVYDIPFDIDVNVDAGTIPFTEFDLSFTTEVPQVTFLSHSPHLFTVHAFTGPYSANTGYRYYTTATGETKTSTGKLFSLRANVKGVPAGQFTMQLDPARQNTMTASIGYEDLVVSETRRGSPVPQLSSCGDGVIGYIDSDSDGIEDAGEKREVCDTAVSGGALGCGADVPGAAACTYVNLGWQCTNTQFGSRNSACTKLTPQQFFLGKVTALINAECYPDCAHPQGLYKTVDAAGNAVPALQYDANGKLTLRQKIYLISQLSTALREFLAEVVQP